MSAIYDNWGRLVAAVLRRELLWQICHDHSRTPSLLSSVSSDFGSSFSLASPLSGEFSYREDGTFMFHMYRPLQISANIKASVRQEEAKEESGQLVIFKSSPFAFGLDELLIAPSVALGDKVDSFGNAYLVRLREDFLFVVKRVSREDRPQDVFEKQGKLIAGIEHENIVKMMGYYINEDECLQILEYFPQGSLETMLHGKNRVHLDWESRLRIAIGAAKGLAHIHGQRFVHGNIKASNIFLNSEQYGCISDKSVVTFIITKYHAPEVWARKGMFSQASDVYSFGVLLIELLTGRSPLRSIGRYLTFADWALHNARDGWTSLAFDKKLLQNPVVKQGMWEMLAVALSCVEKKPEGRPTMAEVVDMLDKIVSK
ncbi:UNVERIFIED_CONTAM: putative inactive receptor kinase [Sesamum angustifolium]|uniref:Inactive receptor kinase n=1 Tax=Sesamum angustifolium TaxID=2727405 RepID=A0AAW2LG36_9LAMI